MLIYVLGNKPDMKLKNKLIFTRSLIIWKLRPHD